MIWVFYTIVFVFGVPLILGSLSWALWSASREFSDRLVRTTMLVAGSIAIVLVAFVVVAGLPAYGTHPVGLLLMVFAAAWLSPLVALAIVSAVAVRCLLRRVAS